MIFKIGGQGRVAGVGRGGVGVTLATLRATILFLILIGCLPSEMTLFPYF